MKISELIAELQKIQDEHGDVPVAVDDEEHGPGIVSGIEPARGTLVHGINNMKSMCALIDWE